jgi:hypothetical protein
MHKMIFSGGFISGRKEIFAVPHNLLRDLTKEVLIANYLHSSKQGEKSYENPKRILLEKGNRVHLRIGHLSGVRRALEGGVHKRAKDGADYGRSDDNRASAPILPGPGLQEIPSLVQVCPVATDSAKLLHVWI